MQSIKILPQHLISKIAAGEVVERPASVVKELIENSLDAKAQNIYIYLEEGGTKKIVVKDDGSGMNPEDLLISFLPHSTSKIASDDDLFSIQSFGFRGEALSSISAVSMLTIKSRPHNQESGSVIEIKGGDIIDQHATGMPCGTEVIVESLFHATPARRKFLREPSLELRSVSEIVTRLALSYPTVGFKLTHSDTMLIDVPSHQIHLDRIQSLLG
nr:ATP-binding protein [Patescibacteria group bacterium]